MAQNDLLDTVYANSQPQVQAPTYQASPQQGSGFQGATGNIAQIADKFLAGVSQGRAQAFNHSMQQKQQTFNMLSAQAQQLQQSDLPPEIKAQQLAKVNDLRGHVFLDATGDGSSKGKKGGGQSGGGDDPNHPGPHILNAVRGMVTGMLGPGKQPGTVDPKELQDVISSTSQLLGNAPKLAQEHVAGLDNQVSQALGPMVKANDGKMPAFSQAMSDPAVMQAFSANMQRNGGKLTPGAQATWDAMQAQEKQKNAVATVDARTEGQIKVENIRGANQATVEDKKLAVKKEEDATKAKLDEHKAQVADKVAASTVALHNAQATKNIAQTGVEREKLSALKTENQAVKNAPDTADSQAAIKSKINRDPSLGLAAWNYLANDKFDTRGLGKDAHKDIQEIKSAAGMYMQQMGFDPGDVFALRAGIKSNLGALSKVTTQSAQVEQFEGQLEKNIDTLKVLDKANPRYDVQFANRVQQAFKTGKGDPEAVNMAAQLHGVSREWAKIMAGNTSSSGATVSDSKDTDAILNKYMSSGQMNSLMDNVIRVDAKNRIASNNDEMEKLRNRIKGVVPNPSRDNGQPPSAPQQGGAPPQQAQQPGPPQQRGAAPPQAQQQPGPPQAALPKPSQPGQKLTDEKAAAAYLKAAGGDVNKARELAKQDKWVF